MIQIQCLSWDIKGQQKIIMIIIIIDNNDNNNSNLGRQKH